MSYGYFSDEIKLGDDEPGQESHDESSNTVRRKGDEQTDEGQEERQAEESSKAEGETLKEEKTENE